MSDGSAAGADDAFDVEAALDRVRDVVVFGGPRATRWTYVSPGFEEFFGVPAAAVQEDATRILEQIHPEDRDVVADVSDGVTEEREFDCRVEGDDGDRWIHVHLQPAETEGIVGVMTDVTEGKRREQQLVLLHRLLQHDIRNDMAVITGWLDVLAEETRGTQQIIDRVRTASEQVLNLTEDTRDIVSATTDAFATQREPTPLGPMFSIIVEENRERYPDATVELDVSDESVSVAANALLSTVFRNLVQNAVLHNDDPEPAVRIDVETRDGRAVISVSDNGPGIPEAEQERLFRMGEKGIDSKGTGLGLYLCRQIVESFDGEIWHDPDAAEGATFRVAVPLAAERSTAERTE